MSVLIPADIWNAIAWAWEKEGRLVIAVDPVKGIGLDVGMGAWLRGQNLAITGVGTVEKMMAVRLKNAGWLARELKSKRHDAGGSRHPANYIKWRDL